MDFIYSKLNEDIAGVVATGYRSGNTEDSWIDLQINNLDKIIVADLKPEVKETLTKLGVDLEALVDTVARLQADLDTRYTNAQIDEAIANAGVELKVHFFANWNDPTSIIAVWGEPESSATDWQVD